ncbi:MAG: RsbRD N-terminal domain-containing protein, partial [Cystobacter sp.]
MSRQLADTLAAREQGIAQRWLEEVRRNQAPGSESRAELLDHVPGFLRQLDATLRDASAGTRTSPGAGHPPAERARGTQRFRVGFSLAQVVREYGMLRSVLLDEVEASGTHVTLGEVRLLTDFVATAIA